MWRQPVNILVIVLGNNSGARKTCRAEAEQNMAKKIKGSWQDDTLTGTGGADNIDGASGNDLIDGLGGDDTLSGASDDDTIFGGDGSDDIDGGSQNDSLDGGAGDDTIDGGSGTDTLLGGDGSDVLDGGSQEDYIDGGAGDDTLIGDSAEDTLIGGDGQDSIEGGSQDDTVEGGTGNDTISGDSGDDYLLGDDGADVIEGGSGSDSLYGGAGNDIIEGGSGSDLLDGGQGDDQIIADGYSGGSDTIVFDQFSGNDTLTGFDPNNDFIHIGANSLDDIILTPTSDPQIWVLTLDGVPDASLTIDYTYHWDTGITLEELETQVVNDLDFVLPPDPYDDPVCLTAGSLVETPRGPVPVERLAEGDRVLTYDAGAQPLRAVLRHRVRAADLAARPSLRPVAVPAGAFGPGRPARDMLVSLQHAFLAWDGRSNGKGEVLIRARHIAEEMGRATLTDGPMASVAYYHLLMDRHHLIRADGVWTETVYSGPAALKSDPVLRQMVRDGAVPTMQGRVRKLLLRKHLRNFADHDLGVGAPAETRAKLRVA